MRISAQTPCNLSVPRPEGDISIATLQVEKQVPELNASLTVNQPGKTEGARREPAAASDPPPHAFSTGRSEGFEFQIQSKMRRLFNFLIKKNN